MNSELKCCFTGYRPSKMPFREGSREYNDFENALIERLIALVGEGCNTFYTGMAMGFDIIAAEAVLLLKKAYPDKKIKLVAVIPFKNQAEGFSEIWRKRYNRIIGKCDERFILSDSYYQGCYQNRNKYMVDNCDFVLTWYDGKKGGTRNTIDYALSLGRLILNINEDKIEGFAIQECFDII